MDIRMETGDKVGVNKYVCEPTYVNQRTHIIITSKSGGILKEYTRRCSTKHKQKINDPKRLK